MRAMILAAGFGTRLSPITNTIPKALVPVAGKPLLAWTLEKLINAGFTDIAINTHYLSEQVDAFLAATDFAANIEVFHEAQILNTGGGIKNATDFLQKSPWFLVHNVDILSSVNLQKLCQIHEKHDNLATLYTANRSTKRYLLFDAENRLISRYAGAADQQILLNGARCLAFNGVHVLSKSIFELLPAESTFSIADCYVRLAAAGKRVEAVTFANSYWRDVGQIDKLNAVEDDIKKGRITPAALLNTTEKI
ncbi:nucleotidyltransferase family protein [bacterium]|nr:nucleotidyltransferase family protein [bacterium]